MRKSFSVRTDIPQKVPIVFKQRAGDLFMFEIKKECTNFLRNVQKGLKIVQNLDTRLLCFLRQKCAYFAIFGTQLHTYCDFLIQQYLESTVHHRRRIENSFVCHFRQFLTSDDLNVWKFQQLSQKKDIISSLCCIRQFLPQMIWMFGIPATIVLNWLVLNLYTLYFAVGLRNFIEGSVWKFEKEKTPCNFVPLSKQGFECYVQVFE